jgi:pimeloyl-ACP methyl ester carboxylesterase
MPQVTSKDGTIIAYDRIGQGPAVIIACGVLSDRSQHAGLAQLLADHFTVYNFDRRGHGESGDTPPYAVDREVEDIAALIDAAGGSACVYGTSSCGVLFLEAAASGLSPKIKKMVLWEPPYIVDDSRPPMPEDYLEQQSRLLREGRRGDMVELFLTKATLMPAEFVAGMRQAPFWAALEALAHCLVHEAILMGDFLVPKERAVSVTVPALVLDGGETPWLSHSAQVVAEALPHAQRRTIPGQPHNIADAALAPVLVEFFQG